MVTKEINKDFFSKYGSYTLSSSCVLDSPHKNGWTIEGTIHEDYYTWVTDFEASHPTLGRVWGDFENKVYADSEEAFQEFFNSFPPEDWDSGDI